jgi:hypothetical protein
LCAPPLVSPCIFEDDVDEGAGDEMNHWGINLEVEFANTQDEYSIHDSNDERFHQDGLYRSSHLIYWMKKIFVNSKTMKNDTSKIAMYVAIGALVAVIILQLMGRLKTEGYEGGDADNTEAELADLLAELEGDADTGEMEDEDDDEEM